MNSERWKQIEELYYRTKELDPQARSAFLERVCGADAELRREVESRLQANHDARSFLVTPAINMAAQQTAEEQTSSLIGKQISHYKILSRIGAGGMGEVYQARDDRLHRTVALKILPPEVAADQDRMRRFIQEARAASAFNHTNVATVYEVGEADGISFIAMEHIEGETLQARIGGRPLELSKIVEISLQIADVLDQAHIQGITHRDIKSANLMLTKRGQVKVLDFGLAKVSRSELPTANSDLVAASETMPGVVMGTVHYMSPEQVLGREVDHRTDIFSLGVVLYEMATGRLPFVGVTVTETMDRVLHGQPEAMTGVNENVPAEMERIVRKCLEKKRERRYQSARELMVDLNHLKRDSGSGTVTAASIAPPRWGRSRRLGWAALAVAVLALVSLGLVQLVLRDQATEAAIDSIAVLPFANERSDPDSEYLSDGITESLINSLSQLPKLRVLARTTVFRYKGQAADPIKVSQELGVRAVLTGRIVQRGDTLSIQVELVDAVNGSQLWGDKYTRKLSDIFVVQDDVAGQILGKLRLKLTGEEQQRLTKRYTENTEAYYLYLKGRYEAYKLTPEGIDIAIARFRQALQIDPSYALAYAGLAETYMVASDWYVPSIEAGERAREAATKAVALDNALSEAHGALAIVLAMYDWDWEGADREFKQALKLNPASRSVGDNYGLVLAMTGRLDESLKELKRAQQFDPLSVYLLTNLGGALYYARRYDEAIEQLQNAIDLDPNFWFAHIYLGNAYEQKARSDSNADQRRSRYEAAIAEYQKTIPVLHDGRGWSAHGLAVAGRQNEARQVLGELKLYKPPPGSWGMAALYTGLGEKDQAFAWLEKARDERFFMLPALKVDPVFESLHSDLRFDRLLRSMGLAP